MRNLRSRVIAVPEEIVSDSVAKSKNNGKTQKTESIDSNSKVAGESPKKGLQFLGRDFIGQDDQEAEKKTQNGHKEKEKKRKRDGYKEEKKKRKQDDHKEQKKKRKLEEHEELELIRKGQSENEDSDTNVEDPKGKRKIPNLESIDWNSNLSRKSSKKPLQLFLEDLVEQDVQKGEKMDDHTEEKKELKLIRKRESVNRTRDNIVAVPAQRILNLEIGKNVEDMLPLLNMDLCGPMISDDDTDEEVPPMPKPKRKKQPDIIVRKKQEEIRSKREAMERYFRPTTTVHCQKNGYIVKKMTYYDIWHFIRPQKWPSQTCLQRHCLDLPLVKLANAACYMKMPSDKWTNKVTLYKVMPEVLKRHTLTIYIGDLKTHKIPEKDRQTYQPSCVIFRRDATPNDRNKCQVPYDRVIIFKHKFFAVNIDGKHVILNGAPESITCLQDIHKLLDILNSITLSNSMIEIVKNK